MNRSLVLTISGLAVALACTKPEPEPTAGAGSARPPVQAPELEQVEYVDPLEQARAAAKSATPGDQSWREGFDHREGEAREGEVLEAEGEAGAGSSSAGTTARLDEEFGGGGNPASPESSAPVLPPPPPSDGPVPLIDPTLSPRDPNAAAQRPPDAQPPPR